MTEHFRIKILSSEEVENIFEKSFNILSNKGIKVSHQKGLEILKNAGANVDYDNHNVRFSRETIAQTLQTIPRNLTLFNGDTIPHPNGAFYVHAGIGSNLCHDTEKDTHRLLTLSDVEKWGQLVEELDQITMAGLPYPQDIPGVTADVHALKVCFENTSKPVWIAPGSLESIKYLFEMTQAMTGDIETLKKNPVVGILCDAFSPFTFKDMDIEVILQCCCYRQPIIALSAPCAGTNSPITIAGQVLLMATEILAIIVMSQLIGSGTPVIAFPIPFDMDMTTGNFLSTSVESALSAAAISQFIKESYRMPNISPGFAHTSPVVDGQSGIQQTLLGQLVALSGCDILSGAGMLSNGMTLSPIKLIQDNTVARILNRIRAGIKVNDDTLAWNELVDIAPGDQFLDKTHTFQHCREILQIKLFNNMDLEAWKSAGSKDLYERTLDEYRELKPKLKPRELPIEVQKELERIVQHADENLTKKGG